MYRHEHFLEQLQNYVTSWSDLSVLIMHWRHGSHQKVPVLAWQLCEQLSSFQPNGNNYYLAICKRSSYFFKFAVYNQTRNWCFMHQLVIKYMSTMKYSQKDPINQPWSQKMPMWQHTSSIRTQTKASLSSINSWIFWNIFMTSLPLWGDKIIIRYHSFEMWHDPWSTRSSVQPAC